MTHPHHYHGATAAFADMLAMQWHAFNKETQRMALGKAPLDASWKDYLGQGGIAASVTVAGSVLAILTACGIIGTALASGIGIVAVTLGLVAGVVFAVYRGRKRLHEYERAASLLCDEDIGLYVAMMIAQLVKIHRRTLAHCDERAAKKLAQDCMQQIISTVLKGKVSSLEELTHLKVTIDVVKSLETVKRVAEQTSVRRRPCNSLLFHQHQPKLAAAKSQLASCQKFST